MDNQLRDAFWQLLQQQNKSWGDGHGGNYGHHTSSHKRHANWRSTISGAAMRSGREAAWYKHRQAAQPEEMYEERARSGSKPRFQRHRGATQISEVSTIVSAPGPNPKNNCDATEAGEISTIVFAPMFAEAAAAVVRSPFANFVCNFEEFTVEQTMATVNVRLVSTFVCWTIGCAPFVLRPAFVQRTGWGTWSFCSDQFCAFSGAGATPKVAHRASSAGMLRHVYCVLKRKIEPNCFSKWQLLILHPCMWRADSSNNCVSWRHFSHQPCPMMPRGGCNTICGNRWRCRAQNRFSTQTKWTVFWQN